MIFMQFIIKMNIITIEIQRIELFYDDFSLLFIFVKFVYKIMKKSIIIFVHIKFVREISWKSNTDTPFSTSTQLYFNKNF